MNQSRSKDEVTKVASKPARQDLRYSHTGAGCKNKCQQTAITENPSPANEQSESQGHHSARHAWTQT
jgi:hypothetical protein